MPAQITVRLPEDLHRDLAAASRRMQRKSSEIIRMALREFLSTGSADRRPADRVQALVGSLESGIPDLARKHRAYILQSLERGR